MPLHIGIAAASMLLAWASPLLVAVPDPSSITMWLPCGLVYAVSLVLRWNGLPGLVLGAVLSELIFGTHGNGAALLIAVGNAACAAILIGWTALVHARWYSRGETTPVSPPDVMAKPGLLASSLVAMLAGSLVNALFGALALKGADDAWGPFIGQFVLGDIGGTLLVGPLLLVVIRPVPGQWSEQLLEFIAFVLFSLVVFQWLQLTNVGLPGWAFLGLMLGTMLLASARVSQAQAVLIGSMLCTILIAYTKDGTSPITTAPNENIALASKAVAALLMLTTLLFTAGRRANVVAGTELRRLNQSLLRAEAVARVGSWRFDLRRNRLHWSPQVYELFGITTDTHVPDYEHFRSLVHPDDRAGLDKAWSDAVNGGTYDFTYRTLIGSEVRWLRGRCEFEFGSLGEPLMAWGTVQDITREVELQEVHEAKVRAEVASRTKSQFLATLSHEIRTPLNGVIGLAEMAQDGSLSEPTRQHYLRLLATSARSLNTVVSDVLDLAKIEAGHLKLEEAVFDLRDLLARCQATYAALAQGKDLRVSLEVAPEVPPFVLRYVSR